MKRWTVTVVAVGLTTAALASQEGPLPLSSFRVESDGIGDSGKISLEGREDDKGRLVELRINAFGKGYVVPSEKLKVLGNLAANGIRISYESGYEEIGGRTMYVHLQAGFVSHTVESALVTVTEDGKVEVGRRTVAPAAPDAASMVTAEAAVVQYIPQAMHDLFDDGRCVAFDAVELRLTAPREWQGSNLVVHCTPGNTNSPLCAVGGRCRFEIERAYLVGQTLHPETGAASAESLFEGALVNLTELPSRTPDRTRGEPGVCGVHHIAMTRRAVPIAHGMIPMNDAEDRDGAWKRRTAEYPHPGDCEPAGDIVMPGEEGFAVVFVCPECVRARRRMEGRDAPVRAEALVQVGKERARRKAPAAERTGEDPPTPHSGRMDAGR